MTKLFVPRLPAFPILLILLLSVTLVVLVTWFVPALSTATTNALFRLRGSLAPPDDIVLVAIDDASLQALGQWPWPRRVMAATLERITAAAPAAIGLDVIYAEPTTPADDAALIEAVQHSGRVVLPAQLYEAGNTVRWLRPLPELEHAAATLGHAHVAPAVDGMVRSIQLSKADTLGERRWAFGLRVLQVAEIPFGYRQPVNSQSVNSQSGNSQSVNSQDGNNLAGNKAKQADVPRAEGWGAIREEAGWLHVNAHRVPVFDAAPSVALPGVSVTRPNEMLINFAGPAGTFAQISLAEVVAGRVPAARLAGKIVLIGAVAASLGDARVVPFMHYQTARGEGGLEMPGVEIHANIIHTMRRQLALRVWPEWANFACALLVIALVAFTIQRLSGWQQLTALACLLLAMLLGSYLAFTRALLVPPLAPMLTGFLAVLPLLLSRTLSDSRALDQKLRALAESQAGFALSTPVFALPAYAATKSDGFTSAAQDSTLPAVSPIAPALAQWLPQSFAAKLRAVDDLTTRLLARMNFTQRMLTSMNEGVLVADARGRIVFANREAQQLFDTPEAELLQAELTSFLAGRQAAPAAVTAVRGAQARATASGIAPVWQAPLAQALRGHGAQFEYALQPAGGTAPRYFAVSLAPLSTAAQTFPTTLNATISERSPAPAARRSPVPDRTEPDVVGVVLLFADITKRVELDRVKTETLQLVSHELRTPLTSIQGLSDVLLKFPVDAAQTREMHTLIHAEAVRLTETINRYLDLTRLESGAQTLQIVLLNVAQLLHDCARQLASVAAEKQISIHTECATDLPALPADAQLLTQALSNLLSNAIKYSPAETVVTLSAARCDVSPQAALIIRVSDQGFGIPAEAHGRIFEKFYRLARDANSNIVGTGLGLALVKEIVERHRGQISFTDNPTGGTTFQLRLPLHARAGLTAQ